MTAQSELNEDDAKVHAVVDRKPTQHQVAHKELQATKGYRRCEK